MKWVKSTLKKLIIRAGVIKRLPDEKPYLYSSFYPYLSIEKLSSGVLLSLMRHEAHRIEKSIYNDIFYSKNAMYLEKAKRLDCIFSVFEKKNLFMDEPTVLWAKKIRASFNELYEGFIVPNSSKAKGFNIELLEDYSRQIKNRRSVRVWGAEQLENDKWQGVANLMIDCAKWSPCSGNRQPWRFKVLIEKEDKLLLSKLKEKHCTSAPLLIFVGMDSRVYGSLSNTDFETALYVDAGAAIMNMLVGAHESGLGTCWNHFARDLIDSRSVNQKAYADFCEKLDIDSYIHPVAILAVGLPKYIPPSPERMNTRDLML